MANKNQVTLTFAGDSEQLERTFSKVGADSKKMEGDVTAASHDIGAGFDRAGEHADVAERRALGFKDTLDGATTSMAGASLILKGDLTQGFMLAGQGAADLAGGFSNAVIPAVKNMVKNLGVAKLALGGLAVAGVAALVIAFSALNNQAKQTAQRHKDISTAADELIGTLSEESGAVNKNTREWAYNRLVTNNWLSEAEAANIDIRELVDAMLGERSAIADVSAQLDVHKRKLIDDAAARGGSTEAMHQQQTATQALIDEVSKGSEQVDLAKKRWQEHEDAVRDLAGEQDKAAAATLRHSRSIKELGDRLRAQTDPAFAYATAVRGVEDAQDAADKASAEFGSNSREYRRAMEDLATAQYDLATAATNVSTTTDKDLLPTLKRMRDDGQLSAKSFEIIKKRIDDARKAAERADGTRIRFQIEATVSNIVSNIVAGAASGFSGGAGLAASSSGGGGGGRSNEIVIKSGGSKLDDAVVEIIARSVRQSGPGAIGIAR